MVELFFIACLIAIVALFFSSYELTIEEDDV
jgi:hypothetical protein